MLTGCCNGSFPIFPVAAIGFFNAGSSTFDVISKFLVFGFLSGCLPKILSVNGLITSEQSPGMTNNAAAQTPANLKLC